MKRKLHSTTETKFTASRRNWTKINNWNVAKAAIGHK